MLLIAQHNVRKLAQHALRLLLQSPAIQRKGMQPHTYMSHVPQQQLAVRAQCAAPGQHDGGEIGYIDHAQVHTIAYSNFTANGAVARRRLRTAKQANGDITCATD